jgi:alpha-mannosidase
VTRLENDLLRVALDDDGHLVSLFDKRAAREVVPAGFVAKVLQLHPDYPNNWPAWDIDPFYNHSHLDIGRPRSIAVRSSGPEEAVLELEYEFSSSRVTETLRLEAGSEALVVELEVEWHEHERLLKLALPLDVHADESVAEIQFGHLRRPTHNNTSWDNARFETVAHRYLYLGEAGYGVALVNSGTYGHDVSSLPRQGGGKAAQARMTVIRSANFPDPRGESGLHRFGYAIVPGATVEDAVRHGYWFNLPARRANGAAPVAPLVALSNDAIVVEAVKAADDRSGDVVVRCYEALGGRADGVLTTSFSLAGAEVTDLLERRLEELSVAAGNQVHLQLRPFQILTLRLRPEQ